MKIQIHENPKTKKSNSFNTTPESKPHEDPSSSHSDLEDVGVGEQVYGHVVKSGVDGDLYIYNTLIHFYAKNGEFGNARKVLDEMRVKDVVSGNVVLSVYCELEDASGYPNLMILGSKSISSV